MPTADDDLNPPEAGDRIVVRTPDRREFRGILVEFRAPASAVVRFDTGWVTTYPLTLIFKDVPRYGSGPDQSSDSPSN